MLDTEEYLDKYLQQLVELDKKGLLPKLDEERKYKVYSIQGSGFGAHKAIVLTIDDEHFLTVELNFTEVKGVKHIYPATKALSKSLKHKMQYLGTITAEGRVLIAKAIAVMKHFGNYFKFCNNCQDYCNKYAAAIGLEGAQSLTTGEKTVLIGLVAAILALLVTVLLKKT